MNEPVDRADRKLPHPAEYDETSLERQCVVRRVRRSGPGGQHRNKVETGIVIRHEPTGVQAEANEQRSQAANLRVAVFRLRVQLALDVRCRRDTSSPGELWKSRCPHGRIAVNPQHRDFPALLAEVLDTLAARDFDLAAAAGFLGCSPSQLIRFLKLEPRALEQVNQTRVARGQHRLR